jgi:hypothetical protein
MNKELSVKTAVCTEYEKLLEECQGALKNWNVRRAEIHHSGVRGKKTDDELRKLPAKYAKAYSLLLNHGHDCETCRWVSRMERRSSPHASDAAAERRLSA